MHEKNTLFFTTEFFMVHRNVDLIFQVEKLFYAHDVHCTMDNIQPVSYKRYFRCNNCLLLLVYTINLSLSTALVDPPPMGTFYMKHALCSMFIRKKYGVQNDKNTEKYKYNYKY